MTTALGIIQTREDQIHAMQCKSCMIIVIFLFHFYLKQKDCNKLCFYITNTSLTDPSMALILICMLFWSFQNYSISYQVSQCCRQVFCFVTRYSLIQSGNSMIFLCTYICTVSADCGEKLLKFCKFNMNWKIQCQCNLTSNLHLNEFAIVRLYSRQKIQCIVMLEDNTYLSN